ncbi:hypothetical protein [Kluyvera ascorbata]|nr:hypothetical protein [Kluyvera ascorbata]
MKNKQTTAHWKNIFASMRKSKDRTREEADDPDGIVMSIAGVKHETGSIA